MTWFLSKLLGAQPPVAVLNIGDVVRVWDGDVGTVIQFGVYPDGREAVLVEFYKDRPKWEARRPLWQAVERVEKLNLQ